MGLCAPIGTAQSLPEAQVPSIFDNTDGGKMENKVSETPGYFPLEGFCPPISPAEDIIS